MGQLVNIRQLEWKLKEKEHKVALKAPNLVLSLAPGCLVSVATAEK